MAADKDHGNQKGAQQHADGQHGDKTREALKESLQGQGSNDESPADAERQTKDGVDVLGRPIAGHHRLQENRQQHDEAEKNSESNRRE